MWRWTIKVIIKVSYWNSSWEWKIYVHRWEQRVDMCISAPTRSRVRKSCQVIIMLYFIVLCALIVAIEVIMTIFTFLGQKFQCTPRLQYKTLILLVHNNYSIACNYGLSCIPKNRKILVIMVVFASLKNMVCMNKSCLQSHPLYSQD